MFSFAAIDPYVESNIVLPTEKLISGKDMVEWGDGNAYPDYLLSLYNNVPTLRAIVNGNVRFIVGDDVTIQPLQQEYTNNQVNKRGDTAIEQVKLVSNDYEVYGGFALQVNRNLSGEVAEIYYIDIRFLRTNKERDVFYYSEKWGVRGKSDMVVYPAFNPNLKWSELDDDEKKRNMTSILLVKDVHTQVYPAPIYAASVKACEIERLIDEFHLSDINNHFVSSAIINFNNGDPGQEMQEEIIRELEEKFTGASNGGRLMAAFNPNKDSAVDIKEFKVEDFGERYKSLSQHSRTQIFTAFCAIPLLFGLTSEANTGFSTEEFEQSFKLYNRTQIRPVQRLICDAYDKIYGKQGVLTIKPFTMGGDTEQNVN
jgi:hypothetical protein